MRYATVISEYTVSVEMLSQKMVSGSLQIDFGNEWKLSSKMPVSK